MNEPINDIEQKRLILMQFKTIYVIKHEDKEYVRFIDDENFFAPIDWMSASWFLTEDAASKRIANEQNESYKVVMIEISERRILSEPEKKMKNKALMERMFRQVLVDMILL